MKIALSNLFARLLDRGFSKSEFEEAEHPRDDRGRFAPTGEGGETPSGGDRVRVGPSGFGAPVVSEKVVKVARARVEGVPRLPDSAREADQQSLRGRSYHKESLDYSAHASRAFDAMMDDLGIPKGENVTLAKLKAAGIEPTERAVELKPSDPRRDLDETYRSDVEYVVSVKGMKVKEIEALKKKVAGALGTREVADSASEIKKAGVLKVGWRSLEGPRQTFQSMLTAYASGNQGAMACARATLGVMADRASGMPEEEIRKRAVVALAGKDGAMSEAELREEVGKKIEEDYDKKLEDLKLKGKPDLTPEEKSRLWRAENELFTFNRLGPKGEYSVYGGYGSTYEQRLRSKDEYVFVNLETGKWTHRLNDAKSPRRYAEGALPGVLEWASEPGVQDVFNAAVAFSQQMMRRDYGDEVTLHRGVRSSPKILGKEEREGGPSDIVVDGYKNVTSWTTNEKVAVDFASGRAIGVGASASTVFTRRVSPDEVLLSWHLMNVPTVQLGIIQTQEMLLYNPSGKFKVKEKVRAA